MHRNHSDSDDDDDDKIQQVTISKGGGVSDCAEKHSRAIKAKNASFVSVFKRQSQNIASYIPIA